jgi:hypothetical protein
MKDKEQFKINCDWCLYIISESAARVKLNIII